VLFVGGDFARKGGFDLLAAWRAGECDRIADLELVTDDPGAPNDVPGVRVIRGVASYSSEWSELWRRADVFVMPTRQEAFGLVFQEAAAAGLPRVGTSANAVPEIIADRTSGLLVAPGDRPALVEALRVVLASAELRNRMGRAAREQVLRDAHPDEYRRRLTWIIQDAAERRRAA
jgi:starch synthase